MGGGGGGGGGSGAARRFALWHIGLFFLCLSVCLCLCLSVCLRLCLPLSVCLCLSVSRSPPSFSICWYTYLCPIICLSICLSVCLLAYLSVSAANWSGSYPQSVRSLVIYRLVDLVARRPPRQRKVPGSNPACAGISSGSSHTSDFKISTPVATLPGAWRYRVSTGTGRPGVSILWLGEVERWIWNFHRSVAAGKIVWADPSLRYTSLLLGR